jgi:hypothetical protein
MLIIHQALYLQQESKKTRKNLVFLLWCSIKDDYRTLVELEDVNVVNLYAEIDEGEDDE